MCKGKYRGSIQATEDTAAVALWFLHTTLEDLQANSPTKRTIKSDGSFKIEEEEAHRLDGPEQNYQFTKLALRDEISSTLGVVLLESGLNYTKSDLYVAFSNSMKYSRPIYVTRSLGCGPDGSLSLFDLIMIMSPFPFMTICLLITFSCGDKRRSRKRGRSSSFARTGKNERRSRSSFDFV
jgi:hypothetical protein